MPPDNMKILILVLLLLLCSTQVLTLRCYTCEDKNDEDCKTETDCPPSANYCMTEERDDKLYRTCEELCFDMNLCCNTDLCEL